MTAEETEPLFDPLDIARIIAMIILLRRRVSQCFTALSKAQSFPWTPLALFADPYTSLGIQPILPWNPCHVSCVGVSDKRQPL